MNRELQRIRDQYDAAVAANERDPFVEIRNEGSSAMEEHAMARVLYEQWCAEQLILVEAASPRAA